MIQCIHRMKYKIHTYTTYTVPGNLNFLFRNFDGPNMNLRVPKFSSPAIIKHVRCEESIKIESSIETIY